MSSGGVSTGRTDNRRLAVLFAGLIFVACRHAVSPAGETPVRLVVPAEVLTLATPAAAVASDIGRVAVIELDGSRIVAFDAAFRPVDTLILSPKLAGVRGLLADRFYYYIADDSRVWRLGRADGRLETWLTNVQVVGMAGYAPGEILLADAQRRSIWHKAMFMQSRRLVDPSGIRDPGAIAALIDGSFVVLSGGDAVVRIDRSGVTVAQSARPAGTDLVGADAAGRIYLMRRGGPALWRLDDAGIAQYELVQAGSPDGFAVTDSGLVVLDRSSRLILYRLGF